jgi:UDPglucose 6-dehydrogenase
MSKIGIIGNGFVGKACQILGECEKVHCLVYDIDPSKCIPLGITLDDIVHADLIFVCVPTPSFASGQCDTSIVETVVQQIKDRWCSFEAHFPGLKMPGIIVRSTVPPGTCERLQVIHMPEYLTERNWREDFRLNPVWHVGVPLETCFDHALACHHLENVLRECKTEGVIRSNEIELEHSNATEMTKYMRNCMLAARVALCNEMEAFCRAKGISYKDVRRMTLQDVRVGSSHTNVPGHDGQRGYGGTCLPKDLKALVYEMDSTDGVAVPMVLRACDTRNDEIDRPQQDWKQPGRSVSEV